MRISNNIMAINSHRMYGVNNGGLSKNMEKLSSGLRVNRAGDDAAGLAISEKMRTQIRGLNMASKNSLDGISLVQTAEGAFAAMHDMMQRIRELAVQGANDTNQQLDRDALALEVFQLAREIGEMERTVQFNGMAIFDTRSEAVKQAAGITNTASLRDLTLQVGANFGDTMKIELEYDQGLPPYDPDRFSFAYRLNSALNHVGLALRGAAGDNPNTTPPSSYNYSGVEQPSLSWTDVAGNVSGYFDGELKDQQWWISFMINQADGMINFVSAARAELGAIQNRLEYKILNLDNSSENLAAAESRIRDADMAKQMTDFTKNNILFQASTAMLAQANSQPQSILSLLG